MMCHCGLAANHTGRCQSKADRQREHLALGFARRQTPTSQFSHFEGTETELIALAQRELSHGNFKPGYREGVLVVIVPAHNFRCGVVAVDKATPLRAVVNARRDGEQAYIQVLATGQKLPAKHVELILYRHDVLGTDATSNAAWEIVSINARPTVKPEPMTPMAMARNFLNLPGGTAATYTAEEFAQAIVYWSQHAMIDPEPPPTKTQ